MANESIPGVLDFTALVHEIDQGLESHLKWNQRLLRCLLLRESPGEEMLSTEADGLCQLGQWLVRFQPDLERFDRASLEQTVQAHRAMHLAVRAMCSLVIQGEAARLEDLEAYEHHQSQLVHVLDQLRQKLLDSSFSRDEVTGLPTRHGLEEVFGLRRKDAHRAGAQLWLAMIDVDHFKRINDTYGHLEGDRALKHLASQLSAGLRESDVLARFGGDEFLAVFLVSEPHGVQRLATRLLRGPPEAPLTTSTGTVETLTVSIGLARTGPTEELSAALERADQALLRAKSLGRNRYELAAFPPDEAAIPGTRAPFASPG